MMKDEILIRGPETQEERGQLDELLWNVLWRNLKLPRNIREAFSVEGMEIELIAVENGNYLGGLVGVIIGNGAAEIRHIAIMPEYQMKKVGNKLVAFFMDKMKEGGIVKISTYARNTTEIFFQKQGFIRKSQKLEHPDFIDYGIWFYKMEKTIN